MFSDDLEQAWEVVPGDGAPGRLASALGPVAGSDVDRSLGRFHCSTTVQGRIVVTTPFGLAASYDPSTRSWSTSPSPVLDTCVEFGEWVFCRGSTPYEGVDQPTPTFGYLTWQPAFTETADP